MEKDNYTKQETEEMVLAVQEYNKNYNHYMMYFNAKSPVGIETREEAKKALKESAKVCREKLTKSLLDKIQLIDPIK